MSLRYEFVQRASPAGAKISELCREYQISRKTGYKWLKRYATLGAAGLEDQSRRPKRSPGRVSAEQEARIVAERQAHPTWGGRKLRARLAALGEQDVPAPSTITAVLRRQGLLDPAASAQHRPYQRFERETPNALWQMDFKGHVALGNGQRCHPLTVLDDHSRFLVGLYACPNETHETVQACLVDLFRAYGLPEQMLMDNGAPWGDDAATRHTRLTVWLMRLGIQVTHGRPYHPQTQGKDERLHRTLTEDLLSRWAVEEYGAAQLAFDTWRSGYNTQRPHEALGLLPPSSRYHPSARPFPAHLPPLLYPPGAPLRKVDASGKISFRNQSYRIGRAFAGHHVALSPDLDHPDALAVFFGEFHVRSLNLQDALC
jgi:transposase InsO family protein